MFSEKAKIGRVWVISCVGVIKIIFSFILNKEIHALRGFEFYHNLSNKNASASGAWTHEVSLLPLTIYPDTKPGATHIITVASH